MPHQTELALRYMTIELPAPSYFKHKESIEIQLIHAPEENPPQGKEAVEWLLLTTIKIKSATDIETCLRWYMLRWRIEDWYRVLKSANYGDSLLNILNI